MAASDQANLLQDPGFEENADLGDGASEATLGQWIFRTSTPELPSGKVEIDSTEHFSSAHSLKLENNSPEQYNAVTQLIEVEPDCDYILTAKIKTAGLETSPDGMGARLCIMEATPPSATLYASGPAPADSDWQEISVPFNSKEAQRLKVLLYLHKASGTVWFDDVEVIKL